MIPNKYSSQITRPKSQGASQAMLYATGLTDADLEKPQVGISSVWYEGNSCNMHLLDLAEKVKEGVKAAGLVGFRFNTIGVSDGVSSDQNLKSSPRMGPRTPRSAAVRPPWRAIESSKSR